MTRAVVSRQLLGPNSASPNKLPTDNFAGTAPRTIMAIYSLPGGKDRIVTTVLPGGTSESPAYVGARRSESLSWLASSMATLTAAKGGTAS